MIIWPISDSGMVKDNPTVTSTGDIKSIAYAQATSETSDITALT